ncbi:hypothetical protein JB92DRAFT_2840508 [Gautieria morchelliformis]|nr:hypothetical protein JB92DRAFT_2840508 [Gautieria morchelliformis]
MSTSLWRSSTSFSPPISLQISSRTSRCFPRLVSDLHAFELPGAFDKMVSLAWRDQITVISCR